MSEFNVQTRDLEGISDSTTAEAMRYLEQAKREAAANPTVQDVAARMMVDSRNHAERMERMRQDSAERLVMLNANARAQERVYVAQVEAALAERHRQGMLEVRRILERENFQRRMLRGCAGVIFGMLGLRR